jgi:glucose-6-phosphate-specific signal transduction histidine kinase
MDYSLFGSNYRPASAVAVQPIHTGPHKTLATKHGKETLTSRFGPDAVAARTKSLLAHQWPGALLQNSSHGRPYLPAPILHLTGGIHQDFFVWQLWQFFFHDMFQLVCQKKYRMEGNFHGGLFSWFLWFRESSTLK